MSEWTEGDHHRPVECNLVEDETMSLREMNHELDM